MRCRFRSSSRAGKHGHDSETGVRRIGGDGIRIGLRLCRGAGRAVHAARNEAPNAPQQTYELNDSHFHLTNYVQEGTNIRDFLKIMGNRVGRVALFGIPLQQMWDKNNTGDFAPTYYLQSDAPLYYYSFTDASIAMAYRSLTPAEQARFDPMITGFNPADMYAADHIRRVLLTFPGVFSGIGEFTIHKEFVSSKIPGKTASLLDPALDRILDFTAETGLVAILHNDIDMPFPKAGPGAVDRAAVPRPAAAGIRNAVVIWAHAGVGRIVHPVKDHLAMMERGLANPKLKNFYVDISWTELAKYVVATPEATAAMADLINRYPDRFLFGTDEVAPTDQGSYLKAFDMYQPMFARLTPDAKQKVAERELRAAVRRSATEGAGVGSRTREAK